MSDKFFYKGRQDARQDHSGGAYQTRASRIRGSKKYPMELTVTSEARRQEVQALVDDAQLHARITVDEGEQAEESITELTALVNKGNTVKLDTAPARNDPCSCGSGKKFKKCCG